MANFFSNDATNHQEPWLILGVEVEAKGVAMPRSRVAEAEREERRDKVMGLLLAGGSTRSIAKVVGVHHATVARDVDARLKGAAEACRSTADLRLIEEERLDALLLQWWGAAQGDLHAFDRVLRLLERRAKLLGLDAAQKLEHTGKDGGPIQVDVAAIEAKIRAMGEGSDE